MDNYTNQGFSPKYNNNNRFNFNRGPPYEFQDEKRRTLSNNHYRRSNEFQNEDYSVVPDL